jgi:hypothetical protein
MKKLWILFIVFALAFTSCEDSISKQEKRAARQRTKTEKVVTPVVEIPEPGLSLYIETPVMAEPEPISYYEPSTTYTPTNTIPTYWYITFLEVQRDVQGKITNNIDWHWAIKLNTPYFDFVEARKDFPAECTGKIYFKFLTQISKESYDSWVEFKRIYHGE